MDAPPLPVCSSLDASNSVCWDLSSDGFDGGPHGASASAFASGAESFVQFSTDLFQSAPRGGRASLVSTLAPVDSRSALFSIGARVGWRKVRFSSSLYIEEWPANGAGNLGTLSFSDDGGISKTLELKVEFGRVRVLEQIAEASGPSRTVSLFDFSSRIPTKEWVRLALEVELDRDRIVRATLDGNEMGRGESSGFPRLPEHKIFGSIGIVGNMGLIASVLVDDLALEQLP
ncbi:MAG: hypothetical protein KF795_09190 [Labilithrix sp.]|nr:hypothetical protein [Labilithrix sp.]